MNLLFNLKWKGTTSLWYYCQCSCHKDSASNMDSTSSLAFASPITTSIYTEALINTSALRLSTTPVSEHSTHLSSLCVFSVPWIAWKQKINKQQVKMCLFCCHYLKHTVLPEQLWMEVLCLIY